MDVSSNCYLVGMERHFDKELEELRSVLARMGGHAEQMVRKAVAALESWDGGLAQELYADDREMDRLELEVEERCLTLLALRQPIATDLRLITAALGAATDLERVGDHAINIAGCVAEMIRLPLRVALPPQIPALATKSSSMLQNALDSFVSLNGDLARATCAQDDEADRLEEEVFETLKTRMIDNPATVPASLQLILVARNLERVADLATNIAEEAIFVAEARVIRHHNESPA